MITAAHCFYDNSGNQVENNDGGGWWIIHDPWGEIYHSSGHYDSSDNQGENEKYSFALMDSRWTVDSDDDGWCILVDDPQKEKIYS